ncbi:MAG TPA: hypothetical protein VLV78_05045 [Thermoanaerobaculia bacterium]|nr:hypothetical protein [Thermoanaerobaculia bacterium]
MTGVSFLRKPLPLFSLSAATVAMTCVAIVRSHAFAANPDLMAWAVTFDLTLTIPLLYWIVIVRSGAARPVTIAPVFAIGAAAAALVLPRGNQQFLHTLRYVAAPLEIVTIALLVQRLAAMRGRERKGDPLDRIRTAATAAFGEGVLAGFVATELAVVWYALLGWTRPADVPADAKPFTVHQRSGWGSVLACLIILVASESIAVHLLVQMWSVRAAWIVTSIDLYGLLWFIGDYNALRLRPSLVRGSTLQIRYGLRWTATVERTNVARMRDVTGESDWKRPGVLKVAMIDAPRYLIELREPLVANGLAGMRRRVEAIAISPDDDGPLEAFVS